MTDDIQLAVGLIRGGQKEEAQRILLGLLKKDPRNESAWLWLVETLPNNEQPIAALQQCLKFIPSSERVQKGLERLRANQAKSSTDQPVAPAGSQWPREAQPANSQPPRLKLKKRRPEIAEDKAPNTATFYSMQDLFSTADRLSTGAKTSQTNTVPPNIYQEPILSAPHLVIPLPVEKKPASPVISDETDELCTGFIVEHKKRRALRLVQNLGIMIAVLLMALGVYWLWLNYVQPWIARQQETRHQAALTATTIVLRTQNARATGEAAAAQTPLLTAATETLSPQPRPTFTPTPVPTIPPALDQTQPFVLFMDASACIIRVANTGGNGSSTLTSSPVQTCDLAEISPDGKKTGLCRPGGGSNHSDEQ